MHSKMLTRRFKRNNKLSLALFCKYRSLFLNTIRNKTAQVFCTGISKTKQCSFSFAIRDHSVMSATTLQLRMVPVTHSRQTLAEEPML